MLNEALKSGNETQLDEAISKIKSQMFDDNGQLRSNETRKLGESKLEKFIKEYDRRFNESPKSTKDKRLNK